MIDEKTTEEGINRPFDITPTHPIWQQMERGVQIILGFSLITVFHFLGESWGQPNVPYAQIFPAIGSVGIAFIYSLLITPVAGYFGMILRAVTPLPNYRINQIRAVIFNITLISLVVVFFIEASYFITVLMEATGIDPTSPASWEHNLNSIPNE
jgi:hypothetical protein